MPKPDAAAFGADVGLFTPPALVRAPVVNPDMGKVPVPFPIKPTAQAARVAREAKAKKTQAARARDAVVAPVDTAARVRVRRGETRTEKKARTGTQPGRKKRGGYRTGDFLGEVVHGLGAAGEGLARAAAEGLLTGAWNADDPGQELPAGAAGALAGSGAAVSTLAGATVGVDLAKAIAGVEHSRQGLATDVALLPFLAIGRPFKGLKAARAAAKAAKAGRPVDEILDVVEETYRGVKAAPQPTSVGTRESIYVAKTQGDGGPRVFTSVDEAQNIVEKADAYLANAKPGDKHVDTVTRDRDVAEKYVAAKQLDPEVADARLDELAGFLEPFIDDAYKAIRAPTGLGSGKTLSIGGDKRVGRVATDADRFRTHAIGVGDPVDMSEAKLIRPQVGEQVDRERAEKVIYEAASRSTSPVAHRIVEAFDEIEAINEALTTRAENDFLAALDPHAEAQVRESEEWLKALDEQVEQDRAALTPVEGGGEGGPPSPPVRPVARAGDFGPEESKRGARILTLGEHEQQLARARSRITVQGEKLVDRISKELDETFVHNVPGARVLTASARVPKHAGREQRHLIARRPAKVGVAIKRIHKVREGSLEDDAHYWYAQIPEAYRNAEGLKLVQDAQKEELQAITSGESMAKLVERREILQDLQRMAETGSEAMRYQNQIQDVEKIIADLPGRAKDVAARIHMMDTLIAHAPPVDEDIITGLRAIADERKKTLVRSGRLDPERAAAREGLVAEWLGLEPDGTEIYIGHRLPKDVTSMSRVQGVSAGTGRVASPRGVGSRNRLVLATTGRVRSSVHVALEDYAASQVFETAIDAREFLGKIGKPFQNRYVEGYTLINPKARSIPPHWRTDELAQFTNSPEDIEQIREASQDLVDAFMAQNGRGDWERLVEEAAEQGVKWDELRMVPNYQVERYYKQFRSFAGRSTPGVMYDMAVDFFATSIVFARVGYIPKNVVQNAIMMLPHQGVWAPINFARAAQVLADPELRNLMRAEIGSSGAARALGAEGAKKGPTKKILNAVAGVMGSIADDPARVSAFLHEAMAEGVISKVNPLLTDRDRAALVNLLTDPRKTRKLNDVRVRSVEAMADFTRLTPDQARIARRLMIIPGWLMAGSRYPFHFAATHPIRSALMSYIALGEPGAPEELQFNDRIDKYFSGHDYLRGIDTPWGKGHHLLGVPVPAGRLRTSSLNPVSTPYELGLSVQGSVRGSEGPFDFETPTAFDWANPGIAEGFSWAKGEGDLAKSAKRLLPNYSLVKDLVSPPTDPPRYPEDVTRVGRLKREIGILPIEVSDELDEDTYSGPRKKPGDGGGGGMRKPGGSRGGTMSKPGS